MIKADNLTRTYGELVAVRQVSFEIGRGQIVGLLGHNGAGKSTIMKMLTGYLEPTSGRVTVDGVDVWEHPARVQRTIGYLPENSPLYPEMAVIDYLDYAASLRGVAEANKEERIGYVLQKTSLGDVATRPVSTLSRGYKQRLGVAQAILNSPSILILDEPTNGLDPSQILEMRALIKELAESATVVLSTHILQEVQASCNRVVIINNGAVALDSLMSDLQNTGRLHISTDSPPEIFAPMLTQLESLQLVSSGSHYGRYQYVIDARTDDPAESASRLTKLLVQNNCKVFELRPIIRDLESIFADISAGRQINDIKAANADSENVSSSSSSSSAEPAGSASHSSPTAELAGKEMVVSASPQGGCNE